MNNINRSDFQILRKIFSLPKTITGYKTDVKRGSNIVWKSQGVFFLSSDWNNTKITLCLLWDCTCGLQEFTAALRLAFTYLEHFGSSKAYFWAFIYSKTQFHVRIFLWLKLYFKAHEPFFQNSTSTNKDIFPSDNRTYTKKEPIHYLYVYSHGHCVAGGTHWQGIICACKLPTRVLLK